jgi:saccharopine dehydrogenase-like protein
MGRAVSAELSRFTEIEGLVLASRSLERAEWAASALGTRARVRAVEIDVRDEPAARAAFAASGCDVVVSCAGPAQETESPGVRAALGAGLPWVSLCDDHLVIESLAALHERITAAGITVLSGCGLSPGITNLLVTLGAAKVDRVDEIEISLALSSSELRGDAALQQFLVALGTPVPIISDHEPSTQDNLGGPRLTYFPEPVGWVETFRQGRPEVVTLPPRYPQLRSLQARTGLVEKALMDIARLAAVSGVAKNGVLRRLSLRATRPLRSAVELLPPGGSGWTSARVDVRGAAGTRPRTTSLAVVDHLSNLAALPLAVAAVALGTRSISVPGLRSADELFRPSDFLLWLTRRGIRIARLEPYPL